MAESLNVVDPDLASRFIADLADFYREGGIYERSSPSGVHGPDLDVASIFNAQRIFNTSLSYENC